MEREWATKVINDIPTNCCDVRIAEIVCLCIVILGVIALIGILVYHCQTLNLQREIDLRKRDEEAESAKRKDRNELRAKKLDYIKENMKKEQEKKKEEEKEKENIKKEEKENKKNDKEKGNIAATKENTDDTTYKDAYINCIDEYLGQ